MLVLWILIVIFIVAILNIKGVNNMFNKPSIEELENYQESVFLHIDEEISKYKKDIKNYSNNEGKEIINEINSLIKVLDNRISECKRIEASLDEKIIKLSEYKKLIQ